VFIFVGTNEQQMAKMIGHAGSFLLLILTGFIPICTYTIKYAKVGWCASVQIVFSPVAMTCTDKSLNKSR